tara:strand:- start:1603 stop:2259 length:657 start_codon:yes stop_codon:yes gene_type:complete
MARHIRTCTARPFALRVQELEKAQTEFEHKLDAKQEENDRFHTATQTLQSENDRLTKEIEELRKRPTTINNYNNNNSVNVSILAYGSEPLPDAQAVRSILLPPENSVARYIALKHFRDPSTSNLRISNKKSKTMQVVEPDVNNDLRWTEKNRKEMIEKMVDENLDELTEAHGAAKVERWRRWYETSGLEETGYDKTEAYKRIERDVENMLLSQRNLPL